jgi:glycosyltransferase involved in cell wall biosynthesis
VITVAMITRNEEGAVGNVVRDIKAAAPDAEILIVDSSTDRTAAIAEEAGAKVIRQFPPKGYSPAMELALRSAGGDVVVTLDCDETYPCEQIPLLASYVLSGEYDLVDASRLRSKPRAMPWLNYLGNWAFALLASIVFCRRLTDLHSGMRAYSKKLLDELPLDAGPPALPVELLLLPIRRGKRLKTVFIDYRERVGRSKLEPIRGAWWTLLRIFKARFA